MIHSNTQGFKLDLSGKVIGIQLYIEDVPNQKYKVSHLRLIDEQEANGRTIAYCSSTDYRGDFYLGWPYRRGNKRLNTVAPVGGSNGEHVISNGFNPPDYGYLGIHLGREPISQIVGGLGLPYKHHVSFEIVFTPIEEETEPENPKPNPTDDFVIVQLKKGVTWIKVISE